MREKKGRMIKLDAKNMPITKAAAKPVETIRIMADKWNMAFEV
jgi:hypothetical protein